MFDIGWTEMLVVACVAILVVGPKDLPKMLRAFGKTVSSVKKLAGDFQKQFDDAVRDAELDEVKDIATGKGFKPLDDIKSSAEAFKKDVKEQMDAASKSVNDAMPDDILPEPVAATAKSTGTVSKAAPKKSAVKKPSKPAAKKAVAKKTVAKKTPTKSVSAKTTTSKATAKSTVSKTAPKKAAKPVKTA